MNPIIEAIGPTRPKERPLAEIISDAVDAGLSDADIKAAVARRKATAPPAFALTDYAGENKAGPLAQATQAADARLAADPLAEGDVVLEDPRWQRLTGHTPADNQERERQAQARGFAQFAVGQAAGPLVGGGLQAAGMGAGLSNVAGGVAAGALPTAMAGGSPTDIIKDAAIGGALPAIGGALAGAGRGIQASRGAQARRLIESRGGSVGVEDSGSGLPEFQGRGKITDADIGDVSREAGRKLLAENDRRFDVEGRQPYRAATAEIDKGQGRNLASTIPLRREMIRVASDPSTDPATRNFLEGQVREMDAQFPIDNGRQYAPESWINGKTSMLWQRAKPGLPSGAGSVQDAKIGTVATVGQKLREAGPYADANRKYAEAKNDSGDFREALGLKRKPSPDENVDERRVANVLARRGQKTTTAGIQQGDERLQELLDANPELARVAEGPELLKAKADLQFRVGNPAHGGMLERIGLPGGALLGGLAADMAGGHGVKGAALGLLTGLTAQNATPIAGRLLYNPARAAVPAGEAIAGAGPLASQYAALASNPIIQAYLQAQQRDKERAAALNAK